MTIKIKLRKNDLTLETRKKILLDLNYLTCSKNSSLGIRDKEITLTFFPSRKFYTTQLNTFINSFLHYGIPEHAKVTLLEGNYVSTFPFSHFKVNLNEFFSNW